jgi:DNA-binding HxlR family transcriptional regulator
VLNLRLHDLRNAGVVVLQDGGGYALSDDGRQLFAALAPLQAWAERWKPPRQPTHAVRER